MGTREGERGYFSPGSKGWAEQFTVTRRDRAALVQMALTGSETWLGPACQQLSHCRGKASHQTHLLRGPLLPYPCPVTAADKTPDSAPQRGVWGAASRFSVCPQCSDCSPWEFFRAVCDPFFPQTCNAGVRTQKSSAEITAKPPWRSRSFLGGGSFLIEVIVSHSKTWIGMRVSSLLQHFPKCKFYEMAGGQGVWENRG